LSFGPLTRTNGVRGLTVDSFELAPVDGHDGSGEQVELTTQHDELCAGRADRRPVVAAEVGDRLEVRHQTPGQPHQLDVTLGLAFEAPARLDAIEITVEVDLQQRRGVIGGSTRRFRNNAGKAQGRKVQLVNENLNDADRIVLRHIVFQAIGQQCHLPPIFALNKTLHETSPVRRGSIPHSRVFTQPGP
jgi:hypothetical protein